MVAYVGYLRARKADTGGLLVRKPCLPSQFQLMRDPVSKNKQTKTNKTNKKTTPQQNNRKTNRKTNK